MSESKTLSTPTAILIGSALIAVGLFLGLRERAPSPPSPAPPPPAAAPNTAAAPPQRAPAPPQQAAAPPATPVVPRDQVAKQVAADIEKHRALLVEKCWKPLAAKQPTPASSQVVFNFTFDASGTMITRGISEDRQTSRPGLGACLSQELPPTTLPPPGQTTYVEVPFSLP